MSANKNTSIQIGMRFGELTVLKKDGNKKNKKNSYYICRCICGKEKSIMGSNLITGSTVSCGCFRKKCAATLNKKGPIEMVGLRFGRLIVKERGVNTSKGQARWWCRCDCGKIVLVEGSSLRTGNSTSCGCKRADTLRSKPSRAIDLMGQRFGILTVFARGPNDSRKQAQWWCRCDCGEEVLKKGNPLRSEKVKSCGCLEDLNRLENCSKRIIKHGRSDHPLYRKLHTIIARCYREKARDYPRYGGRGILVCDDWRNYPEKFIEWALENGWEESKDLSIDRIDNNGNYCPENCRVISCVDNTIKRFTDKGQGLMVCDKAVNIRELCKKAHISPNSVKSLSMAGYSQESIVVYGNLKHYQKIAVGRSIKAGMPLSIDEASKIGRKHKIRKRAPGYVNYLGMKGRCYNPNDRAYDNYGGRGITVCSAWRNDFDQFIRDMGPPPHDDYAIHRINNDGNYEPSNCAWVSRSENTRAMHHKDENLDS